MKALPQVAVHVVFIDSKTDKRGNTISFFSEACGHCFRYSAVVYANMGKNFDPTCSAHEIADPTT